MFDSNVPELSEFCGTLLCLHETLAFWKLACTICYNTFKVSPLHLKVAVPTSENWLFCEKIVNNLISLIVYPCLRYIDACLMPLEIDEATRTSGSWIQSISVLEAWDTVFILWGTWISEGEVVHNQRSKLSSGYQFIRTTVSADKK